MYHCTLECLALSERCHFTCILARYVYCTSKKFTKDVYQKVGDNGRVSFNERVDGLFEKIKVNKKK